MRAERITSTSDNCYILTETKTQNIFKQIEAIEPEIVIIDSIQTLHTDYIESTAGSISQIRETTAELIKFAKETNIPYSYWPYYQRREHCRPKNIGTYG
jgi:DNA repair protein RadA/Sms